MPRREKVLGGFADDARGELSLVVPVWQLFELESLFRVVLPELSELHWGSMVEHCVLLGVDVCGGACRLC